MKKLLLLILVIVMGLCLTFAVACGNNGGSNGGVSGDVNGGNTDDDDNTGDSGSGSEEENEQDAQILAVYNLYVANAEQAGQTPLTYEEWLASIKGEKGDKGDKGETGATIEKVEFDEQGRLVITLTDGTVLDPVDMPEKSNEQVNYTEGVHYQKIAGKEEYAVVGLGIAEDSNIVIASTYKGLPVTSIGYCAFEDCNPLTSIKIPASVTSIGSYAFCYCDNLTSVEIPASVTSIGEGAFEYCGNLTSVVIPASVTSIGDNAFSDCDSLTSIEIPASVTSIGDNAFMFCDNLTIYCEAESQPEGWSGSWNNLDRVGSSRCPVVWGYKD